MMTLPDWAVFMKTCDFIDKSRFVTLLKHSPPIVNVCENYFKVYFKVCRSNVDGGTNVVPN